MSTPRRSDSAGSPIGAVRAFVTSPYLLIGFAMFFWAGSTVLVRGVHEDVPPMGLSFWRTLLGLLIILPFTWREIGASAPIIRANWKILCALGFLLIVGGNAILFLSLQFTIAINAGVINSVEPVMILIVAWLLFRDRVSAFQMVGVVISLVGVITLIGRGSIETLMAFDFNRGDLLVVLAYLSWAFYAVLLRKTPKGLSHTVVLALILATGSLFLLPLYLVEAAFFRPTVPNLTTITSILILAVFSSVVSVLCWNRGIAAVGSGRAALFIHLIPAFTVIMAILFLGEAFEIFHGAGLVLIGLGIYLATIRRG